MNNKVTFKEIFDAIHYLNNMAKVIEPQQRIVSNSYFYKVKSYIVEDLVIYGSFYGVDTDVIAIENHPVQGKRVKLVKLEFTANDNSTLMVHQELTPRLRYLLNANCDPTWEELVTYGTYMGKDKFPPIDPDKYTWAYDTLQKWVRQTSIFVTMWFSENWPYRVRLEYLHKTYPEIQVVAMGKVSGNDSQAAGIKADVLINNKKIYSNVSLKWILKENFYDLLAWVR